MKNSFNFLLAGTVLSGTLFLTSCGDDDLPPEENDEEQITRVTLTFSSDPDQTSDDITAVWFDADGDGVTSQPTIGEINLEANTQYTLSIVLENTLADDVDEQDVTAEIVEEADEHMFFFAFTTDIFTDPTGNGNVGAGSRNDPMNYDDTDGINPLGLETTWTTGDAVAGATFTVILKHQPALVEGGLPQKSATSTSLIGDDDFNQDFVLNIN